MSTEVCARMCLHICLHLLQLCGFSPTVFRAVSSHGGLYDFSNIALCPPWKTPWEALRGWELCSLFLVRYRSQIQTVHLMTIGSLCHRPLFMRNSVLTHLSLFFVNPLSGFLLNIRAAPVLGDDQSCSVVPQYEEHKSLCGKLSAKQLILAGLVFPIPKPWILITVLSSMIQYFQGFSWMVPLLKVSPWKWKVPDGRSRSLTGLCVVQEDPIDACSQIPSLTEVSFWD